MARCKISTRCVTHIGWQNIPSITHDSRRSRLPHHIRDRTTPRPAIYRDGIPGRHHAQAPPHAAPRYLDISTFAIPIVLTPSMLATLKAWSPRQPAPAKFLVGGRRVFSTVIAEAHEGRTCLRRPA